MADKRQPLMIPPEAASDDKAIEMIRGWIAGGELHSVLNVGHWHETTEIDERDAWGIMLADIARHVAEALEEAAGLDPEESLSRVVHSLIAELAQPLSKADGQLPASTDPAAAVGDNDDPRRA